MSDKKIGLYVGDKKIATMEDLPIWYQEVESNRWDEYLSEYQAIQYWRLCVFYQIRLPRKTKKYVKKLIVKELGVDAIVKIFNKTIKHNA